LHETASYELSCVKIGSATFAVGDDENKNGKERYKKSQNRICRKAPSEPILAKFGLSREVADVITHADFDVYKLSG